MTKSLHRQRIGIITGSGPEAGIDLWTKVLAATREQLQGGYQGDLDAPELVIHSVPALGLSMELPRNDAAVWRSLAATAEAMAGQVEVYAIACNTLNVYAARLQALGLPARLVSMQGVLQRHLQQQGIEQVALLASAPVMALDAWSAYRELPQWAQVELPAQTQALHQIIYDVKAKGGADPAVVRDFEALLAGIQAPVVLLACTELPLIPVRDERLLDVTDLLAQELARIGQQPRDGGPVFDARS
jgi:aspartate racemase